MATSLLDYGWQSAAPQLTPLMGTASNSVYFGTAGTGDTQLSNPSGVAFSPDGSRLAILERGNRRIHMLGVSGNTISHQTVFGATGSGAGQFSAPYCIAFSRDGLRMAVTDTGNHRIQILSVSGDTITHLTSYGVYGTGAGQYAYPRGVSFSPDGARLVVADTNNNRIQLLGIASAAVSHIAYYGTAGSGNGQLSRPTGAMFDTDGVRLVVSDKGNNRIQIFEINDITVTHRVSFGTNGSGIGQFNQPATAAFSPDGAHIAVSDVSNNRIQILRVNGNTVTHQISYGAIGSTAGRLSLPTDVAFSPDGYTLAVADTNNNRIQLL